MDSHSGQDAASLSSLVHQLDTSQASIARLLTEDQKALAQVRCPRMDRAFPALISPLCQAQASFKENAVTIEANCARLDKRVADLLARLDKLNK